MTSFLNLCIWICSLIIMVQFTSAIKRPEVIHKNKYSVKLFYYHETDLINTINYYEFNDFKKIEFNQLKYEFDNCLYYYFLPSKINVALNIPINNNVKNLELVSKLNVVFYFLQGLDVNSFYIDLKNIQDYIRVYFYHSNLKMLIKDQHGNYAEDENCDENNYKLTTYFNDLAELNFRYGTRYSLQTCILIFKNATIHSSQFFFLSDSYFSRNLVGFKRPKNTIHDLKTRIKEIYYKIYKVKIDRRLLDYLVFRRTKYIQFEGEVFSIDNGVFIRLDHLKCVRLKLSNLRVLFTQGLKWLDLDYSTNLNLTTNKFNTSKLESMVYLFVKTFETKELSEKINRPYMYPDEDFCYFVDFPFNQLVFLDPHMECRNKNCSCTQYWLIQYVHLINKSAEAFQNFNKYVSERYYLENYEKQIDTCNFKTKIQHCKKSLFSVVTDKTVTFNKVYYDSQYVEFVTLILIPVFSLFSLIINIININVIVKIDLSKTPEDQQQITLKRFMLAYSIINLIYCAIQPTSLMNKCIDSILNNCSQIYLTQFAQYYKIIVIEYMGSVVKTLSNVVYFGISVNRYILLDKNSKIAKFVENTISPWSKRTKVILIILIIILICGLNSNSFLIYRVLDEIALNNVNYEINLHLFFTLPFILSNSNVYGVTQHNYETIDVIKQKSIGFETLSYVNFVLNNLVLFFAFTLVDILLLISFKNSTDKKKKIFADKLNDPKVKNQLNELEKGIKNMQRVIIANTIILLIIKVVEMFVSISKFKIWKENLTNLNLNAESNSFCYTVKICTSYEDVVKVINISYFSFSIISFNTFNKNFRFKLKAMFNCCNKQD